jgi:uncharacterized membrane protein
VDSYRIQLFLHVLAVVIGLGVAFVEPFLQAFAERQGVNATRNALRFIQRIENILVTPGAILVAVFGVGLIFDDRTGYRDDFPTWLMIAIAWYVVAFVVAATLQRRNLKDAIEALEGAQTDDALPVRYVEISRRIQMVGGLLGVSIIGVLFMMVWGAEGGF